MLMSKSQDWQELTKKVLKENLQGKSQGERKNVMATLGFPSNPQGHQAKGNDMDDTSATLKAKWEGDPQLQADFPKLKDYLHYKKQLDCVVIKCRQNIVESEKIPFNQ